MKALHRPWRVWATVPTTADPARLAEPALFGSPTWFAKRALFAGPARFAWPAQFAWPAWFAKPVLFASLALVGGLVPMPAQAAGGANCSLTTTPLAFGKYVPSAGSPADFTATISVACTASGPTAVPIHGTITLTGPGGPAGRQLTSGTHTLRYQLYVDPGRTSPWGNGSADGGAISISGVVNLATPFRQVFTIYGRVLARQSTVKVGQYADQLTAVLTY